MMLLPVASTIIFILILLSFLVLIHELGHFLAAKWVGVRVDEFGLGYPPRVRTLFTWWQTPFSLNAIPLGGFVKLHGDDAEMIEGQASGASATDPTAFANKTILQRLIVILAGVTVNFLFGIVAFGAIYTAIGIPTRIQGAAVGVVLSQSPAEQAGLQTNDVLLRLGEREPLKNVESIEQFIAEVNVNKGKSIAVVYRRGQEERSAQVYVRQDHERPEGEGAIGISLTDQPLQFFPWYQMPFRGAVAGLQDTFFLAENMIAELRKTVVNGVLKREVPKDLSGPIGIVDQTYDSKILTQGWIGPVRWLALISVSLAVMNLLPIPVLDGGRAVFVLLEPLLGKSRRIRWEQQASGVSFLFLMGLIVLVSAKDIWMVLR